MPKEEGKKTNKQDYLDEEGIPKQIFHRNKQG